jgi:hypothetical protein
MPSRGRYERTLEIREKMRLAQLGKKHTLEAREKMKGRPAWNKGQPLSDETKAKLSAAKKGQPGTFLGRLHTPESRAKISAAKKGKPLTPAQIEGRHKAAEANRGRKNSPETLERMRAAAQRRDPSTYARGPQRSRGGGYQAIHLWLQTWHPKIGICEECGKNCAGTRKGTHHAFLRHPEPHTRDRSDYAELCPACHVKLDRYLFARSSPTPKVLARFS